MNSMAHQCLEVLFSASEKSEAGVRIRLPALTGRDLRSYHELRSLQAKEDFEATMKAAEIDGAVKLTWESRDQLISRVSLVDLEQLAVFLGKTTTGSALVRARERFLHLLPANPVLSAVLERWRVLKKVRGLSVNDVDKWLDAASVIAYARARSQESDEPVRNASATLFNDSKRIARLSGALDVLLVGELDVSPRDDEQVWRELGLFREDQPMLMAGSVVVRRTRVTCVLDAPYGGIPADSVLGLKSRPERILSIENQTNFREEARKRFDESELLIYSAGMPSPAWRSALGRLLTTTPKDVPVYHWGDFDEGGFRIAANIAAEARRHGRRLLPFRMDPESIPEARRRPASPNTVRRMRKSALAAGWEEIAAAIEAHRFTAEQEGL